MTQPNKGIAAKIAAIYALVGSAWILFSDRFLSLAVREPEHLTRLQTVKGWFYVAVTSGLLFWLVNRYAAETQRNEEDLRERNEELCMVEEELRQQLDEYELSQQALGESEARLRRLMEQAADAFFVHDEAGRFIEVNRQACESLGYHREELLGMTIADVDTGVPPEDIPALLEKLRTGGHVTVMSTHRRRDGTEFPVEVRVGIFTVGQETLYLSLARDISERQAMEASLREREEKYRLLNVELEERVRQRTAELERANRELESFSYSVSHDLRAPLRHMDGFSKALLEDYADRLDDEGKNYLVRIRGGAQRMGRLIDDILQLADVSRSHLERRAVNLSGLAQVIVAALRQTDSDREVTFRIADGVKANGDPRLLRIVLENLFGNAWKYTGRRTGGTVIEFGVEDRGGEPVYLVRDNGVGFSMAYVEKLFQPFQRLHRAEEFEGTGIGLATVRRVIERHGGRVWAEGAEGAGACFYFTLGG